MRQTQIEGRFTDSLTSTPQTSQSHQKHGKSDKLLQSREYKGDKKTKCNVTPWTGFWDSKRTFGKH